MQAAGLRYSGRYAGLPRVSSWSIWNEPNQPGWLAPQWRRVGDTWVPNSPRLYRQLVSAARTSGSTSAATTLEAVVPTYLAPDATKSYYDQFREHSGR